MVKGTIYYIVAALIFVLCSYTIHIVVARHLGPSLYGVFGVVFSVFSVFDLFVRSGVGKAVSKFVAEEDCPVGVFRSSLRLQLWVSSSVTILYLLSSDIIASVLGDKLLGSYLRISALCIVPYALVSTYNGYLNGLRKFDREALSSICYSLIKITIVLLLLLLMCNIEGIIVGYVISAVISVFISRQLAIRFIGNLEETLVPIRGLILFAMPVAIVSITETLLMNIDILLVKRILHDNTMTGLYVSAANLARIPWHIHGAFYMTLFPLISFATAKKDYGLAKESITQSLRYFLIVILPISFLISISSANLIKYFYSDEFISASSSLSVLVFGIMLMSIFILLTGINSASGRPYVSLGLSALLLPISIVSNLIFIPKYGLIGAAVGSTIAYGIGVLIAGILVFIKFGKCINIVTIFRILLACFSMLIAVTREPDNMVSLFGGYFLGILVYMVVLTVLQEFTTKDIRILRGMLKGL
jgi:O-antigen/teichoic acid export membrane protein